MNKSILTLKSFETDYQWLEGCRGAPPPVCIGNTKEKILATKKSQTLDLKWLSVRGKNHRLRLSNCPTKRFTTWPSYLKVVFFRGNNLRSDAETVLNIESITSRLDVWRRLRQ